MGFVTMRLLLLAWLWGGAVLAEVVVTPTPEVALKEGEVVAYCPTLQVAWQRTAGLLGGPIGMEDADPLVAALNEAKVAESIFPEAAFYVYAGKGDGGVVARIRRGLQAKFGRLAPQVPAGFDSPMVQFVAYAHLQRMLPFPKRFTEPTNLPLQFKTREGTTPVRFFGTKGSAARGHPVAVLEWHGPERFALQFRTRIQDEFIVIEKQPVAETLAWALKHTHELLTAKREAMTVIEEDGKTRYFLNKLAEGDTLAVPIVAMRAERSFTELCGKNLTTPGFERSLLGRVHQSVAFRIDGKGAVVRSTASVLTFGGGPPGEPRRFIVDKPYLITVWKAGQALPYLALWVGDASVMVPFRAAAGK